MALPLPDRGVLVAYCDRVFAAADQALATVADEDMRRAVTNSDGESDLLGGLHCGPALSYRSAPGHDRVPARHPGDARHGDQLSYRPTDTM